MAKNEMCPCNADTMFTRKDNKWLCCSDGQPAKVYDFKTRKMVETKVKSKRIRCPECGRRIMVGATTNHDEDFVFWRLPPHKVKGWYKPKRKKKVEKPIRRV